MIFTRRGIDIDAYPSLKAHLLQFASALEPKPADWSQASQGIWPGRKPGMYAWYEIQDSVEYWELFEAPKIVYQVVQFDAQYRFDNLSNFGNDKTFFIPTHDAFLLGLPNSPLMWWHNWRYLPHMKDEALNPAGFRMEALPIADPTPAIRSEVEEIVTRLIELTRKAQEQRGELLDWLRVELGVEKPGQKLEAFADLSADDFVAEVRERRSNRVSYLTPAAMAEIMKAHESYGARRRSRLWSTACRTSSTRHADSPNEEIALLVETAPPRMPGARPTRSASPIPET